MKIHFCDLCNESVPQSELDEGRAFMRKGRVVCAKCDSLMTLREDNPSALPATAGPFGSSSATQTATLEATLSPAGALPFSGDLGKAAAPAGHHHHPHVARGQRSGSGVAVGLFAMALTAAAFYWLTERSDKLSQANELRQLELQAGQLDIDARAMQRTNELESKLLTLEASWKLAADNEHTALSTALEEAQRKQRDELASFNDLRGAVAELRVLLPTVQRHDAELLDGARKFNAIDSKLASIEIAMAELKKQMDLRPGPGAGPTAAPATPVGTPAWMGLVKDLESANNGDRWVAVSGLGETRDPAVAEYLLPRLKDVDIFVRMATARVLGDLKSTKATSALIEALNDQDSSVREAAYISLCSITNKSFPFEAHQEPADRAKKIKAWQDWWKKAQEEGAAQ